MLIPQSNRNNVTILVETPRGRTAATRLSPTLAYDSFVQHVWEAARKRDNDDAVENNRKRSRSIDEEYRTRNVRRNTFAVHDGKVINRDNFHHLLSPKNNGANNQMQTVSLRLRLRGGIDRQNRVGSKFGGGGVSSSQNAERERKERLKQLALESIELSKDPYLMKNHLGTYECKLCLTLHTNEANYLAHTQGKKHQAGLARRAHMEKLREKELGQSMPVPQVSTLKPAAVTRKVRIGRPAYQVYKSRDPETNQRCLSFELNYPEIGTEIQPRHRFMSAYEQRVDSPPDKRFQYLLFAADPYETVAFKIPNEPIDKGEGRFVTHWDADDKKFILTLYFVDSEEEEKKD